MMDRFTASFPFFIGMTKFARENVSMAGIIQSLLVAGVSAGISIGVGMYVTQSVIRVEFSGLKIQMENIERRVEKIQDVVFRPVYEPGRR